MAQQALTPQPNTPLVPGDPRADFMWRQWMGQLLTRVYTSSQISHNSLADLQGGTTDEYYHLTSSQNAALANISSLSVSSVLFVGTGGVIAQDNSNFVWDNTNKRLGIGTTSPAAPLDIRVSSAAAANTFILLNTLSPNAGASASAGYQRPTFNIAGSGIHSNFSALQLDTPVIVAGGGTVTNAQNLLINGAPTGATNNWAIRSLAGQSAHAGNLRIGSGSVPPTVALDVTGAGIMSSSLAVSSISVTSHAVTGGLAAAIRQVTTAAYSTVQSDFTVLGNASSLAITVHIPNASTFPGKVYNVKKIDSSGNAVTISSVSLIDGVNTQTLAAQWNSLQLQCNSTAWYVL